MKTVLLSLTLAAIASTQPALSPPQVGFLQDSANSLRPVFGIAGNFLMGDSTASDVVAAAFSGSFGILKTDSALIVTDRQGQRIATQDAPAGLDNFNDFFGCRFILLIIAWPGRHLLPGI